MLALMAEVVTGLNGLVEEVVGLNGRSWLRIEPSLAGARKGARMTRKMMEKRAAEVMRMTRDLGRARMNDVVALS